MIVDISMKLDIDDDFLKDLCRLADHHIEELLDLDEFPEIKSVSNVILRVNGKDNENGEE